MNKYLVISGLFLLVSLFNLANVYLTGSGFGFVLGLLWLGASAFVFIQYRKMKAKKEEENKE